MMVHVHMHQQYPLFFSEHSDGGGFNRYFEIYNPTQDTVVLDDYGLRVGGNPTTPEFMKPGTILLLVQ